MPPRTRRRRIRAGRSCARRARADARDEDRNVVVAAAFSGAVASSCTVQVTRSGPREATDASDCSTSSRPTASSVPSTLASSPGVAAPSPASWLPVWFESEALGVLETKILNEEVTLRAIVEGGAVVTTGGYTSRVTDRYFGNGKIRGFEANGIGPRDRSDIAGGAANNDALGGNMFAAARFEADFPLGLPEEYGIKGGAFLDVGTVWGLDNRTGTGGNIIDDSAKLRSAIGLSVLWDTPLGPLRFNFSKALKKETYDKEQRFDLTISTKF